MTRRLLNFLMAVSLPLYIALLHGCDKHRDATASADSSEQTETPVSASQPAAQSGHSLQGVELVDVVYLAGLEQTITVSPEGKVRSVRVEGKAAIEVREGLLTAAQTSDLKKSLDGWERLDARYGGVPDGPAIRLRYGRKLVTAGSEAPPQVVEASGMLREIARKLPLVAEDPQ